MAWGKYFSTVSAVLCMRARSSGSMVSSAVGACVPWRDSNKGQITSRACVSVSSSVAVGLFIR